jgi:EpsI family protein
MAVTSGINSWIRSPQKSDDQAVNLQHFPKQLQNWVAEEYALDDRVERVLRTDQTLWRYYTDTNGKRVELFVAYYRDQKFGAQVHSPQHCLPGSGWTILRHGDMPRTKRTNWLLTGSIRAETLCRMNSA